MRVVVTALASRQFDELPTHIKDRVRRIFARLARWGIVITRVGHRDGFDDD